MPSWAEVQADLAALPLQQRGNWLATQVKDRTAALSQQTGRNIIFYASAWLQKPGVPGVFQSVSPEDLNGLMSALKGMDFTRPLFLIMHTPGGSAEAAETIVDYLWSKFADITVAIPTYSMSAGTMIALASNRLLMGRQSQLGPTDPQLIMGQRAFSAHSIVQQFTEAKTEISNDPRTANAWYPVLQPFGPALLQEARKALAYGDALVERWLATRMFSGRADAAVAARNVAQHFSGSHHESHGRRINRDEVRAQGVAVDDLEASAELQNSVLTLYHVITLAFEVGPATKVIVSSNGSMWVKNVEMQIQAATQPAAPPPTPA